MANIKGERLSPEQMAWIVDRAENDMPPINTLEASLYGQRGDLLSHIAAIEAELAVLTSRIDEAHVNCINGANVQKHIDAAVKAERAAIIKALDELPGIGHVKDIIRARGVSHA